MTEAVTTPESPRTPDWVVIEADYRAGIKGVRQIAAEHGVSHPSILKRAKKGNWPRDLNARIQAQAEALVTKAAVTAEATAAKTVTENAVVDANARLQYQLRMAHRQDIALMRGMFQRLAGELNLVTVEHENLLALFDAVHAPDPTKPRSKAEIEAADRARAELQRVIDVHSRIDGAKRLVDLLEKVINLERRAFGMSVARDGEAADDPGSVAGAAGKAASRSMTDVERAVRLAAAMQAAPEAMAKLLGQPEHVPAAA